jgi:hypothetical protein
LPLPDDRLSEEDRLPEEFGEATRCVPISAALDRELLLAFERLLSLALERELPSALEREMSPELERGAPSDCLAVLAVRVTRATLSRPSTVT